MGTIGEEVDGVLTTVPCPRAAEPERCEWATIRRATQERRCADDCISWLAGRGEIGLRYWSVEPRRIRIRRQIDEWLEAQERGRGLTFLGPPGVGKTFALSYIAQEFYKRRWWWIEATKYPSREARDRGPSVRYVLANRLMRELMQRPAEGSAWGEPWVRCEVLMIDEFGGAYEGDYPWAQLQELIETRHARLLTTLTASNLSWDDLHREPRYARVVDRLVEANRILEIAGPSQRTAPARRTTQGA